MKWAKNKQGFTIVELLIVVVVIAILAAITIVSYNGIQNRAKTSALASELESATKFLEMEKIKSTTDTYPDPATTTFPGSSGTVYSYILVNQNLYCVDASKGGITYGRVTGRGMSEGSCVFNLVKNPKGIGSAGNYMSSGWFFPLETTTDTAGVSWNGRSDWHRLVWTGAGNGIERLYVDLASLVNGQTYTASVLVGNPGTASVSVGIDFSDQSDITYTIAPGGVKRISTTGSRSSYDEIYRFIDLNGGPTTATGLLITDAMLTRTNVLTGYGDGDSPGWAWEGASGLSRSVGPVKL